MANWNDIEKSKKFQDLTYEQKQSVRDAYWESNISSAEKFKKLTPEQQSAVKAEFMGQGQLMTPKTYGRLNPSIGKRIGQFTGGVLGGLGGAALTRTPQGAMAMGSLGSGVGGFAGRAVGGVGDILLTPKEKAEKSFQNYVQDLKNTALVEGLSIPISMGVGFGGKALVGRLSNSLMNTNESIRSSLRDYLKSINTEFGKRLSKIWSAVGGKKQVLNADGFVNAFKNGLQEGGVIDDVGNFIGKTAQDKKIYALYESLKSEKNVTGEVLDNYMKGLSGVSREAAKKGNRAINPSEKIVANINENILSELETAGVKGIDELKAWYAPQRQFYNTGENLFKPFARDKIAGNAGIRSMLNYFNPSDPYTKTYIDEMIPRLGLRDVFQRTIQRNAAAFGKEGMEKMPFLGRLVEGSVGLGRFGKTFIPKETPNVVMPLLKTGITSLQEPVEE